jgi:hypothetical protein
LVQEPRKNHRPAASHRIFFAHNVDFPLHLTCPTLSSMQYCSEESILAKQICNSFAHNVVSSTPHHEWYSNSQL